MIRDDVCRDCVETLWALIGAARAGDESSVRQTAAAAVAALHAARGDESHLLLHEVDGVIHANGRRLQLGVDVFAAAKGINTLLRSTRGGEVRFDASVDAETIAAWARCCAAGPAPAADADAGRHDPVASGSRRTRPTIPSDTHLRAVFLQHQLIASLTATGPVPPMLAKVVVQAVVDRLLALPAGLEPLTLLQADEERLRRSLYVAVLTVVFARVAGWPEERLADLGGAALLHDIGGMLDARRPAPAGFVWLLERGIDEFWLRSAIVARTWREDPGASVAEIAAGGAAVAALVRMAVEAEQLARGSLSRAAIAPTLRTRLRGKVPEAFLDVAHAAFACMPD